MQGQAEEEESQAKTETERKRREQLAQLIEQHHDDPTGSALFRIERETRPNPEAKDYVTPLEASRLGLHFRGGLCLSPHTLMLSAAHYRATNRGDHLLQFTHTRQCNEAAKLIHFYHALDAMNLEKAVERDAKAQDRRHLEEQATESTHARITGGQEAARMAMNHCFARQAMERDQLEARKPVMYTALRGIQEQEMAKMQQSHQREMEILVFGLNGGIQVETQVGIQDR